MNRRIEITEELINDGQHTHIKGDVISMSSDKADGWVACGWAKDAETGEQGERRSGPVKLGVNSVGQKASASAK